MSRPTNPFDTIFGFLWMAFMVALAIGGVGAVLYDIGWLSLKLYDWMVVWLE